MVQEEMMRVEKKNIEETRNMMGEEDIKGKVNAGREMKRCEDKHKINHDKG